MPYSFNPLSGLGLDQSIPLDGAGKIPSDYLPSYVDDVVEYANLAGFPATGETGKIYVAIDTGFTYRWSGSVYIQINSLTGTFAADAGTAAAPSISIGTADNGLYAPAEDQVAISSSGTQRVNFGTGEVVFNETGENYDFRIEGDTEPYLVFVDASTNRVGLGTSTPGELLEVNGNAIIKANATSGANTGITLGETGFINVSRSYSSNAMVFRGYTTGTADPTSTIRADGQAYFANSLGIGTTAPTSNLSFGASSAVISSDTVDGSDNKSVAVCGGGGSSVNRGAYLILYGNEHTDTGSAVLTTGITGGSDLTLLGRSSTSNILLKTDNTERLRIDSSGRLLVGTSSGLQLGTSNAALQVSGNDFSSSSLTIRRSDTGSGGANLLFAVSNGTLASPTIVSDDDQLAKIRFYGYDGSGWSSYGAEISAEVDGTPGANDMPGRLVFSTTADGASSPTERMRISQGGFTNIYTNTSVGVRTARTLGTEAAFTVNNGASSILTGTTRFQVMADGDCENTNNAYTGISDIKLKENIVDANSQWDDIKALRVVNYNFKPETGAGTFKQLGLIAQEVEKVSPGLVGESIDCDAEGNDLGTVTKNVNYSVLYMKAVKALQEAMERIETLEQRLNDAGIA